MAIRIPKSVPKSLPTLRQKSVHTGLGKGYIQYSDITSDPRSQQLRNKGFVPSQQEWVPDLEGVVYNKEIINDLRHSPHPFRFQKEGDVWKLYIQPEHYVDAEFVGAKAAAEASLAKVTGSMFPRSAYLPSNLMTLFSRWDDPFKAISNTMASKIVTGTKSAYSSITDSEMYKIAKDLWDRKILNSRNGEWEFEDFWKNNKDAFKKLMWRIPSILFGIEVTQNEKGDQ